MEELRILASTFGMKNLTYIANIMGTLLAVWKTAGRNAGLERANKKPPSINIARMRVSFARIDEITNHARDVTVALFTPRPNKRRQNTGIEN